MIDLDVLFLGKRNNITYYTFIIFKEINNMEEKSKPKRVMTRVGDIFCVELGEYKVYFQFVAVDTSQLNSTTIRVFETKYPLDYVFRAEEVVNDDVSFFAHTMLKVGLKQNLWTKVGKSKNLGDLDQVLFRTTSDWTPYRLKAYRWWVGGINQEYEMIGELTEEYKKKPHFGWVMRPIDIVEKIEFGDYQVKLPY